MCIAITLKEETIDVVIDALVKKMGSINTRAIVRNGYSEKMQQEYDTCERALDLFTKAKESFKH